MKSRQHLIRRSEVIITLIACVGAATIITYGRFIPSLLPAWAFGVLLAAASLVAFVHSLSICRSSLRRRDGFSHLGSAVFGVGVLFAVVLPGFQLLAGVRQSRLESLGFPTPHPAPEIAVAFLLFLAALGAFYFGETVAEGRRRRGPSGEDYPRARSLGRARESRVTYGFLILVGTALLLINGSAGQAGFAARGTITGQGPIQLLGYGAPVAVAMAVLNRHWGSRWLMGASIVSVAFMIPSGIRTPLIIIAAAAAVRSLQGTAHRRFRGRLLVMWAVAIYVAATLTVALSTYRGINGTGGNASLAGQIASAASDPFAQLQAQGVDTIDGLILSTKVNRGFVGASWTDPAKAVLGFIPHQLWPNKPTWLSSTVTQAYTNTGGGGIFLSGPGYLLIVYGSVAAIPIGFAILGAFSQAMFRRMREPSIWTALLAYFLVRFFFAGDAFDAFHVLGLCLVIVFARAVARVLAILRRPVEMRRDAPSSA